MEEPTRCNFVHYSHGVEHAHQSCEAEADGEHGLHAHLQTEHTHKMKKREGNLKLDHI